MRAVESALDARKLKWMTPESPSPSTSSVGEDVWWRGAGSDDASERLASMVASTEIRRARVQRALTGAAIDDVALREWRLFNSGCCDIEALLSSGADDAVAERSQRLLVERAALAALVNASVDPEDGLGDELLLAHDWTSSEEECVQVALAAAPARAAPAAAPPALTASATLTFS